MALTNIFREPRREIIEQAFGVSAVAAWIGCAYVLAGWAGAQTTADHVIGTMFIALALFLLVPAAFMLHALGELICDALANMGADPRPRQRY